MRTWRVAGVFQRVASRGLQPGLGNFLAVALVLVCGLSASAAPVGAGVKRALLIGINDYQALPKLRGAIHDVETLEAILKSRYGFRAEHIRVLIDGQATRAGILEAFERLDRESGPNDIVFIHYSGHGSQVHDFDGDEADDDGMDETICPQDARTPNVPDITDDELDRLVGRMNVRWLVMSMDSCHSGTVMRNTDLEILPRMVPPDERESLYGISTRTVVHLPMSEKYVLFTGAAANESALDGPFGGGRYHGLFSYGFTQALASAPPGATAREIMQAVGQELEKLRPKLGGRALPDPQLEGPRELLDRSLIPVGAGTSAGNPNSSMTPRLAYAEVRSEDRGSLRLIGGAQLGAVPGSVWSIYPQRETRFQPGRARGLAVVERIVGLDAVAKVVEGVTADLGGGRAVLVSPPPASHEKTSIRLRNVPDSLRVQIGNDLGQLFGDAVELVGPGKFAAFVVDCEQRARDDDYGSCVILDAAADEPVARIAERSDQMASGIADVIARSVVVQSLFTLSNRASGMQLQLGIVGRSKRETPRSGMRGLVVSADLSPHRLRFYQPGSLRTYNNSLQLEVQTSKACYLTLVSVDSEGKLQQIFPNRFQSKNFYPDGFVPASSRVTIPDSLADGGAADFHFDYGPPAGEDTIRAFCMTQRVDAERLRTRIGTATSNPRSRAAGAVAARNALSELGHDLSRAPTRGLVVVPATSGVRPQTVRPALSGADWNAASVTLEISE